MSKRARRVLASGLSGAGLGCLILGAVGLFRDLGQQGTGVIDGESGSVIVIKVGTVNIGFFIVGIALLVLAVLAFRGKGSAD